MRWLVKVSMRMARRIAADVSSFDGKTILILMLADDRCTSVFDVADYCHASIWLFLFNMNLIKFILINNMQT